MRIFRKSAFSDGLHTGFADIKTTVVLSRQLICWKLRIANLTRGAIFADFIFDDLASLANKLTFKGHSGLFEDIRNAP